MLKSHHANKAVFHLTLVGLLAFATGDGQTMQDINFEAERGRGWFRGVVDFLKNRV